MIGDSIASWKEMLVKQSWICRKVIEPTRRNDVEFVVTRAITYAEWKWWLAFYVL